MMKRLFFLIIVVLGCCSLSAQELRVRIFSTLKVRQTEFVPSFGKYTLTAGTKQTKLTRTSKLNFKEAGGYVEVRINDTLFAKEPKIRLAAEGLKNFFRIKPTETAAKERRYDNGLEVKTDGKGGLILINLVEQENYIAGVVQSETWGATTSVDFFKVQAICCRNYIYKNCNKHSKDGYNLCDDVHCQAYHTRANQAEVVEGAYKSRGEVIVDEKGELIETLFYSNSGGQSANAKDVWGKDIPYLTSVMDTFSVGGKHYAWEKFIKEKTWLEYFKSKGLNVKDAAVKKELLNYSQKEGRKSDIMGVNLVEVRKKFDLKSTFFDVQPWGSEVKLSGRGYGHGVGMSQEGAIRMCEDGYEYWQVIEHYFKGAKVVKQENVPQK